MSSLDCIKILLDKNEIGGARLLTSKLEEKIAVSFSQLNKMNQTSVNRLQGNDLTIRYLRHTIKKMKHQQMNEVERSRPENINVEIHGAQTVTGACKEVNT